VAALRGFSSWGGRGGCASYAGAEAPPPEIGAAAVSLETLPNESTDWKDNVSFKEKYWDGGRGGHFQRNNDSVWGQFRKIEIYLIGEAREAVGSCLSVAWPNYTAIDGGGKAKSSLKSEFFLAGA
jgi:hypothetical protein